MVSLLLSTGQVDVNAQVSGLGCMPKDLGLLLPHLWPFCFVPHAACICPHLLPLHLCFSLSFLFIGFQNNEFLSQSLNVSSEVFYELLGLHMLAIF